MSTSKARNARGSLEAETLDSARSISEWKGAKELECNFNLSTRSNKKMILVLAPEDPNPVSCVHHAHIRVDCQSC